MSRKKASRQKGTAQSLRKRAEALLDANPSEVPTLPTTDVQALVYELNVHQVELEIQNEELREAQVELARSRDRYSNLYDFGPCGFVTLDKDGRVLEANVTAAAMLGVERKTLRRANLSKFVSSQSQDDFYLHRQAVFSSTTRKVCELDMHKSDGTPLAVRLESMPQPFDDEPQCHTALIDESDLRRTRRKIQEKDRQFFTMVNQLPLIVWLYDTEGRPEFVNQTFCDYFGVTRDEMRDDHRQSLIHPDDRDAYKKEFFACVRERRPFHSEARFRRRDGQWRWIESWGQPRFNADGEYLGHVGTSADTTERTQTEMALRKSEERLRLAADATGFGTYEFDLLHNRLVWSPRLYAISGLPETEETSVERFMKLVHPEDRSLAKQYIRQILESSQSGRHELECRIIRPDGEVRWIRDKGRTIFTEEDGVLNLVRAIGTVIDITEQKWIDEQLRQLNENLEEQVKEQTWEIQLQANAMASLSEGVMITGDHEDLPEPRIRFVNEAMCRITGFPADELIGKTPHILYNNADRETLDRVEAVLAADHPCSIESTCFRKDGSPYDAEIFISPIFDNDGLRTNFVSIHRDITERKRTKKALEESQRRLRLALESGRMGVWELNIADNSLKWDRAQSELFGMDAGEKLNRDRFLERIFPTDRARVIQMMDDCVNHGKAYDIEFCIQRTDGHIRWLAGKGTLIRDEQNRPSRMIGVNFDITGRKKHEIALRESEMRFRAIFDQAIAGIHQTDSHGRILLANDCFCQLLGYSQDELMQLNIKEITHPDDWEKFESRLEELAQSGTYFQIEKRSLRKDGSEIWLNSYVSAVTDSKNQSQSLLLIATDITAAKKASIALQNSEERLRLTLNTINEGVLTTDRNGKINELNSAIEHIFGYRRKELIGRNLKAIVLEPNGSEYESAPPNNEILKRLVSGDLPKRREKIGLRMDGSRIPIEVSSEFLPRSELIICVIRDITVRRRLEREILKVADDEKRVLAHDLHDTICQELGGLGYMAGTLADGLKVESHAQAEKAKRIAEQLLLAMESARRISHSLDPLMESPDDLQVALRLLARNSREVFNIDCRFECVGEVHITSRNTAINLYRIAQEAIYNAYRHGKASEVVLGLKQNGDRTLLTIADNGCGLPALKTPDTGRGFRIMKYRIATLGGRMKIVNRQQNGVQIVCSIPNFTSDE